MEYLTLIAMLALSLGASIFAAEITLRTFFPQPLNVLRMRSDGVLSHVPGVNVMLHGVETKARVQINDHGLRDLDRPLAKPPAVTRVLVIGDSMIEGLQVDLPLTMPKQLERFLSSRFPAQSFDVINAGVSGSSGPQAARYLEKDGVRQEPDLVLVAFTARNDVREAALEQRRSLPPAYSLRTHLRSRLHLYSLLERALNESSRLRNAVAAFGIVSPATAGASPRPGAKVISMEALLYDGQLTDWERSGYERLFESYERILEICRETDVPVLFVLIPTYFQATGFKAVLGDPFQVAAMIRNPREPQDRVLGFLRERQVASVDLLPLMRDNAEEYYLPIDQHFTAKGNAFAAEKTRDAILINSLMPQKTHVASLEVPKVEQ